ncbi:hypothetical protein [Chitinophaga sp. Ak27]|uniref:hypothetical protein n=1 Tax=Chitinophaga sp. Ak27 TaxID=2726116 RepID=UPI00145EDFCE|nr:hypothetical protein [Chitinophaga sp. Ak27]NLU94865.1 hypothetical protein [Chitinophaga sp. Ak27]
MKKICLLFLSLVVSNAVLCFSTYAKEFQTAVLINPPESTAYMAVDGNQCTDLTLRNQNVLSVLLSVAEPRPLQPTWDLILLPFASGKKTYCVFAKVPVRWNFTVSTVSSAAHVVLEAAWDPFIPDPTNLNLQY